MAGKNDGLVGQGEKFRFNGVEHEGPGASGQVGPAYPPDE